MGSMYQPEDMNNCPCSHPGSHVSQGQLKKGQNFDLSALLNSVHFGTLRKLGLRSAKLGMGFGTLVTPVEHLTHPVKPPDMLCTHLPPPIVTATEAMGRPSKTEGMPLGKMRTRQGS